MTRKPCFLFLCIAAFVASFIAPPVFAGTETFDESYDVSSGTRFEIRNRNGSVSIRGWDRSRINVHAVKKTRWGGKLKNVDIQVTQGVDFRIETVQHVKNPRVSVSYDIRVPVNVVVGRVRTTNGKIGLEGTHGDTDVRATNGKIEVTNAVGDIAARTTNGAIEIEDVEGFVSASTTNGAIDVNGAAGVIELETTNGTIEAEVAAVGGNQLRIRTTNGGIALHLASGLDADLEAKTSNGKIKLHDLEVVAKEISDNTLRGKIGNGGKRISCRTSNGQIVLKRLK